MVHGVTFQTYLVEEKFWNSVGPFTRAKEEWILDKMFLSLLLRCSLQVSDRREASSARDMASLVALCDGSILSGFQELWMKIKCVIFSGWVFQVENCVHMRDRSRFCFLGLKIVCICTNARFCFFSGWKLCAYARTRVFVFQVENCVHMRALVCVARRTFHERLLCCKIANTRVFVFSASKFEFLNSQPQKFIFYKISVPKIFQHSISTTWNVLKARTTSASALSVLCLTTWMKKMC